MGLMEDMKWWKFTKKTIRKEIYDKKKTPRINREKKLEEARREKRVRDHPKINQMWTTRKEVQEEENSDNKNHN